MSPTLLKCATFTVCCFVMLVDSAAFARDAVQRFDNGVAIRIVESTDEGHFALRLDSMVGTDHETSDGGEAAVLLAAILYGRTPNHAVGQWVTVSEELGLRLIPHLTEHSSGFTLAGRDELLSQALWLLGEKLRPPSVPEADVRKIRPAIFLGAESDKYRAITSRGDEVASLRSLVLGPRVGRTDFESRIRGSRLSANAVEGAIARLGAAMRPRVTLVVASRALERARRLVEQHLKGLPNLGLGRVDFALSVPTPSKLNERVRARFDNPRDSSSMTAVGWNLSHLVTVLGWSKPRTEATADVLVTALTHPGGVFTRNLSQSSDAVIDFKAEVSGNRDSVLALVTTCRPKTHSTARKVVMNTLRSVASDGNWSTEVANLVRSRIRDMTDTLRFSTNLANAAGLLWTSGQLGKGQSVENWVERHSNLLRNVTADDLEKLIATVVASDRRAEARFDPTRTIRGREIGLTEEIVTTYGRIVTDSRCPREDAPKMKWTDLLAQKYRIDAETYVKLSKKLTARSRLMRRISNEATERCAQFRKLRKIRSYEDIVAIHRSISCGPASIQDFDLRQKALERTFEKFDLDRSLYRPLLAMAREDPGTQKELRRIERKCRPKYGPGVVRR